jgi:DNA-binding NtrC family response regulator
MRVLVIDDDEIFARLLVEILDQVSIEATYQTDGSDAFELLNRETYDLCIIDERMPSILGSELAEAIRKAHPQTKIVLASAFPDRALQEYASRNGILLLAKPFTKLQLFDSVKIAAADSVRPN